MKIRTSLLIACLAIVPALASATPYCRPCPLDCSQLGLGKKDCSQLAPSGGACCIDLTQKGLDLVHAQDRANRYDRQSPPPPHYGGHPRATVDQCPPGFHPSEQKCSPEERRRGCKDIRTPSGLGCVNR